MVGPFAISFVARTHVFTVLTMFSEFFLENIESGDTRIGNFNVIPFPACFFLIKKSTRSRRTGSRGDRFLFLTTIFRVSHDSLRNRFDGVENKINQTLRNTYIQGVLCYYLAQYVYKFKEGKINLILLRI